MFLLLSIRIYLSFPPRSILLTCSKSAACTLHYIVIFAPWLCVNNGLDEMLVCPFQGSITVGIRHFPVCFVDSSIFCLYDVSEDILSIYITCPTRILVSIEWSVNTPRIFSKKKMYYEPIFILVRNRIIDKQHGFIETGPQFQF